MLRFYLDLPEREIARLMGLKVSVATGRVTVLNDRHLAGYQYEQVMYSSATGSVWSSGVARG